MKHNEMNEIPVLAEGGGAFLSPIKDDDDDPQASNFQYHTCLLLRIYSPNVFIYTCCPSPPSNQPVDKRHP
jgi:hypothetical protein